MSFFPSLNTPDEIEIIPLQPVSDSYKCVHCKKLLRDPVQTPCGCRLCKMCAVSVLKNKDPTLCPGKSEGCGKISLNMAPFIIMDDKATRKDLAMLKVRCPFNCDTTIKLCELKPHVEGCDARITSCHYCKEDMAYNKLALHEENCPQRILECTYCHRQYKKVDEKIHFNLQHSKCCDNYCGKCPYCENGKFTRYSIVNHKEKCPNKKMWKHLCQFDFLNCNEMFNDEASLDDHIKNNIVFHLALSLQTVEDQKHHLEKLKDRIETARKETNILEKNCDLCELWAEKCENALQSSTISESLQSSSQRLNSLNIGGPSVFESIDEVLRRPASHRGPIFTWRITNYKYLESRADRADATNTTFSIFSPPFYTSEFGYKLCLRAYPNGDGNGKKEYFSLFIVILSGDYDNIQAWPFNKLVTLTVIDSSTDKKNLSEKFRADPNSPCFDQPINRRYNVATGCPRFIQKHKFQSKYISTEKENGTVYIQAKFD